MMRVTLILLAIGLPWTGALLIWLAGRGRERLQHALAVTSSLAGGAAALLLLGHTGSEVAAGITPGGVFGTFTFVTDGLGVFLAVVATVVGGLAVLFSVGYMAGEKQLGRYYVLVLLFIGAMVGLVLSGSLLLLFLFWEVTALCSYALISFYNDDPRAVAGGIKALIITQLGGVGLLLGALASYSYLGDYQISTLLAGADGLPVGVLAFIAFGFLFAAMAKSAQVPFHTWLPDAMEAPTPVSALIHAATMVNAGVYLLARFYPAFAGVPGWRSAVVLVGTVTALLAALMALTATDLKRVLAYSTVSQLGYMVYAIGTGAIFAAQFHLLSHALFKALLFLAAGAVIHGVGTRDMREMGGLRRQMPFTATVFLVGAAALAGIPPFNGFWSKELVLEGGLAQGPAAAYGVMLVGAGLTALYTARMVWLVFFGRPRAGRQVHPAGYSMRLALAPLAVGTLASWLLAGPFGRLLAESLPFHHLHVMETGELVVTIGSEPATALALLLVGMGLAAWAWRRRLAPVRRRLSLLRRAAEAGFGFEDLNRRVAQGTQRAAGTLQLTQTGQLSWNVAGIVGGLLIVLLFLVAGG